MKPDPQRLCYEKNLSHACGWLGLGKLDEAAAALARIPEPFQGSVPTRAVRGELLHAAGRWAEAANHAQQLTLDDPDEPGHWVHWAYATRRANSLILAERILQAARTQFPDCAIIHFNLACYAAQLGRLDEVGPLLATACRLDPDCKALAATDPDLEPYRRARPTPPSEARG